MSALTPSDFNIAQDLARILNIVPHYWSREPSGAIRFLAHAGTETDASEFCDYLDEDFILMSEDLDDSGYVVGVLMHEQVEGEQHYVQLTLRSCPLPGPMLVEGHVWPTTATQEQVEEAILALKDEDEDQEGTSTAEPETADEPQDDVPPYRGAFPKTTATPRGPVNVARSRHLRTHHQDTGFLAWLRRLLG